MKMLIVLLCICFLLSSCLTTNGQGSGGGYAEAPSVYDSYETDQNAKDMARRDYYDRKVTEFWEVWNSFEETDGTGSGSPIDVTMTLVLLPYYSSDQYATVYYDFTFIEEESTPKRNKKVEVYDRSVEQDVRNLMGPLSEVGLIETSSRAKADLIIEVYSERVTRYVLYPEHYDFPYILRAELAISMRLINGHDDSVLAENHFLSERLFGEIPMYETYDVVLEEHDKWGRVGWDGSTLEEAFAEIGVELTEEERKEFELKVDELQDSQ